MFQVSKLIYFVILNKNFTYSHHSKVDEYGFERPENFNYASYEEFMSEYLKVLAKRAKKWSEILGDGKSLQRNIMIKRYIRKGIPGAHRGLVINFFHFFLEMNLKYFFLKKVWLALSGAEDMKNSDPNLYQRLLVAAQSSEVKEIIKMDLPRTFPDNIFFNNTPCHQLQLYNILLAFAHQNKVVGYCQVIVVHKQFIKKYVHNLINKNKF